MLLRLLGLLFLSTLCSTIDEFDDTEFFEETQNFEELAETIRVRRSLSNSTYNRDIPVNPGPGNAADMSVMYPDTSVCDVYFTSPDPISIDQIPFFCLCAHCRATTGPKGERGDRGLPGFQGSPGRRGFMGYRGRPGFTGPRGTKGQKGDQGDKGQAGPIGFPGIKGELGVKGEKGDYGDEGPIGPLGPQGEPGSCLCETVMGPPGIQGPPGPAGARGLPGIGGSKGAAGAKGDKGDLGADGKDGASGLKGEQGEPGPCDCTDGADGAAGQKGQKGDTGPKGVLGPKGEQGDIGIPGPVGDPGYPGIPGPCSIAVQSAFCVALETPFPTMNFPVRFTKTFYNVQGHYNTAMGLYIAPVNGTYVFNLHLAVKDKILVLALIHNFEPKVWVTETTNMATTSQKMVLKLKENEMVWLQVTDNERNGMFADGQTTSTFSGFLLSPDSCHFGGFKDWNHNLAEINITRFETVFG